MYAGLGAQARVFLSCVPDVLKLFMCCRAQQKPAPSLSCAAVQTDLQQQQQPASTTQPQPEAGPLSVQGSDSASDPELSSEETPDVPRVSTRQ